MVASELCCVSRERAWVEGPLEANFCTVRCSAASRYSWFPSEACIHGKSSTQREMIASADLRALRRGVMVSMPHTRRVATRL